MPTSLVGGKRARAVIDSVYYEVERILTDLGWFDSGRAHLPIDLIDEDPIDRETVAFNTLAVVPSNTTDEDVEMGSNLSDHRRTFYLDFFAENQAIGEHLINDLGDALQGRMASIQRGSPYIPLYDYSQATPPLIRNMEVEDVVVSRAPTYSQAWQKYWYSIQFLIIDFYDGEPTP